MKIAHKFMIQIPKLREEGGEELTGSSPEKSPKALERAGKKIPEIALVSTSPYRPRSIEARLPRNLRRHSAVYCVNFDSPVKTRGFPRRAVNTPLRLLKKVADRPKSCISDSVSVVTIDNIERFQQLLPYYPLKVHQTKPPRKNASLSVNGSYLSLGIIKDTGFTHTNYRRYAKQNSL